jgi:hypothetical protein
MALREEIEGQLCVSFCERIAQDHFNSWRLFMMTLPTAARGSSDFDWALNSGVHARMGFRKVAPVKVKFTMEEDARLLRLVQRLGAKDWEKISIFMEGRNPRQCRERWKNYLNPNLRKGEWTPEEDQILEQRYAQYGTEWNKIAPFLVNRSGNAIRNRWMMIARHRARALSLYSTDAFVSYGQAYSPPPSARSLCHGLTFPVTLPDVKERVTEPALGEKSFPIEEVLDETLCFCQRDGNFDSWLDFPDL